MAHGCLYSVTLMNRTYLRPEIEDFYRFIIIGINVLDMICKLYHVLAVLTIAEKLRILNKQLEMLESCFHDLMPLIRVRKIRTGQIYHSH